MKVLLVERSRLQQTLISRILAAEGLVVVPASSLLEAMQILQSQPVDIICSGYHLEQGQTGIDLAKKVRSAEKNQDIPIILLVSDAKQKISQQALNAGVTEIYSREDLDVLSKNLKKSLDNRKQSIKAHILYVEDSKVAAFLMMKSFREKTGFSFEHFVNAEEALQHYRQSPDKFAVVITDVVVEGSLNGLEFVREIRKITPENYKTPILTVSGFDDVSRRVELLRSGANDYIVKPYVEDELMVRVNNLILMKNLFDQVQLQQEQLYKLATKDQLTGLNNRHGMELYLDKLISTTDRHQQSIGILFFDIDHFKQINDQYGHGIGDDVLEKMGNIINDSFRAEDFCVRHGGEEFIVVLVDVNCQQTCEIAEKLRKKIEQENIAGLNVTISIGAISARVKTKEEFNQLLEKADQLLYKAKESGRNCVCGLKENA